MGVSGQQGKEMIALQKVFQNIVKLFMDGRLRYEPVRTITIVRDHVLDGNRLRTARKESRELPRVRRLAAPLEEAQVR